MKISFRNIKSYTFPAVFLLLCVIGGGGTWVFIRNQTYTMVPTLYLVLAQISLGFFVYFKDRDNEINSSFLLFSVAVASWNAIAMIITNPGRPPVMMIWDKLIFVPAALMLACLLDFTLLFPRRPASYSSLRRGLIYLVPILLIMAIPFDLIIKDTQLINGTISPIFGAAYPFFVIYALIYVMASLTCLITNYFHSSGVARGQLRYIFLGVFLLCVGLVLTNLLLPWFGLAGLAELGPLFSLFPLAFTAYAIVKHRLLDISVVVSRFVAEFIAVFILGTIYLLIVWLYWANVSVRIDVPFVVITIIFGILVGQFHQRLRIFFQTTADKLFLRGKYDYYDTLSEASTRTGEKLSIPSILNILYDAFYNTMEISNPQIFLPEHFTESEKISKRYLIYDKETFKPNKKGGEILFNDPIVKQLIESRKPICDPKNPCRELVIPCLLENRLIATFVLGRKLSEDPYTDEDISLLEGLASQAAIALDHTRSYEKIRSDLEAAEKVLARSQRLASLGTLIAGVTHEIRNPLTVIRSETERLPNQERDQEYLKNYRDLLLKHIDRISGIVQRMLGLAKEKPKRAKSVDLREVIEQTLQFFIISKISVKQDLKPVSKIKANLDEMHEIFVNLIQNAIEAMPNGGTLTLKTYMEKDRVVAEVSDTGSGIPEEIQEKIFDPFYSTRHEGVGLGLSIVYRIVREHDGDVIVKSKPGDGTTFKILF